MIQESDSQSLELDHYWDLAIAREKKEFYQEDF